MGSAPATRQRVSFFPKADAAVLSTTPPSRPQTAYLIFDKANFDIPIAPWPADVEKAFYPPQAEAYATAAVPDKPSCMPEQYLRSFLAENERLRLSMLWYYTRDILKESGEFFSGLQEKVNLAHESTGWEFAVIGILDVNVYVRLATVALPLATLPRGEIICAHTVTQPPGSVFLLPNMMEDWRFQQCPYVESGGLRAYAGAPLRLQNEYGDSVGLGSLCVASSTAQEPLTKPQQDTLARLADWVVSDIVQWGRARRQRERRRMTELIAIAQGETDDIAPEDPVLKILRTTYPDAIVKLSSSKASHIEFEGRDPILASEFEDGLWEDVEFIDNFIMNSNHQDPPSDRVVRIIAAQCEVMSGPSLLLVASKDFRLVFDDVDTWFVQTCAGMISQTWHKRLLTDVMKAKENFLRGFSHHLRTPIHGILGSAELLAEDLKTRHLRESAESITTLLKASPVNKAGESSIYLDTIQAAGRDLISIVNSMITLNTWADIAIKDRCYAMHTTFDLETELANEIIKTFSSDTRYKASIIFNHDLPPDFDSLRIDLGLLRDCLLPLVFNAIQHTPQGIVMVTTSIHPDTKELIIDIEDNGRGIHRDHQQRIFEPYEKVDMHSTGAGLGLTLASKFATLLHGSVSLVSSSISGGSHFRAKFQEVELIYSPNSSQSRLPTLNTMPFKFHNMSGGSDDTSLCEHFSRSLTSIGFTPSDDMKDSLVILGFVSDLEQRRKYMSQVPLDQVAICLVPDLENDPCLEQAPDNIIFVNGPFVTSTIKSALEDADKLLSKIKASRINLPQVHEPMSTIPQIDGGLSIKEDVVLLVDSPQSKEQLSEEITNLPVNPDSGAILQLEYQADSVIPVNSTVVVPIFVSLKNSPNPTALLVDDNIINLRIMQMYCSKRGLPYVCATDGLQAVEVFMQHQLLSATGEGAPIQLIFMDLQMPGCDGIEATRQIRSLEKQNNWSETSLFMVTGQDSQADKAAAEEAGADEYLVKPVRINVFDRVVKQRFPAFEAS